MKKERKLSKNPFVRKFFTFLIFLVVVYGVDWLGMLATNNSLFTWSKSLQEPAWKLPGIAFGPIWAVLYFLIAGAGYFIWTQAKGKKRSRAFTFWVLQLILSGLWAFFFFYLEMPVIAAINLILMIVFVLLTLLYSYKLSRGAVLCLLPYLIWLIYTATLDWGYLFINK